MGGRAPSRAVQGNIFSFVGGSLFLRPRVRPFRRYALPGRTVLEFRRPVIFIKVSRRLNQGASGSDYVGHHRALIDRGSVVLFAISTRGQYVPFVSGRIQKVNGYALYHHVLFFPMDAARVPVDGPRFFYFRVLRFRVRGAIVYGGNFRAFIIIADRPVGKRTSRTHSRAARAVLVSGQLFHRLIGDHGVIFRTLTSVITTSLFIPLRARAKGTATIQNGRSVIIDDRGLRVPAMEPRLTCQTLEAAFTRWRNEVFLVQVRVEEVGRPNGRLFAVYHFRPAAFRLASYRLVVSVLILYYRLNCFVVVDRVSQVSFVSRTREVTLRSRLVFARRDRANVVMRSKDGQHSFVTVHRVSLVCLKLAVPCPHGMGDLYVYAPGRPICIKVGVLTNRCLFAYFRIRSRRTILI